MSPGIGMPEMLVVLVLALVVVGPQQLPVLMRRVGRMVAQARGMAKEFQASFDEIGRQAELDELRKEIEALKSANPIEEIKGEIDQVALEAQNDEIRKLKMAKADPFPPAHPRKPMTKPVSKPASKPQIAPEDEE